jgi:ribonuclease BN (tRNA processing enzyme)
LKSFTLQSQPKMLSDSRLPGDPRAWPFTRQLKHLIFTHDHPDHIGSAAAVVRETGARTYMHPLGIPMAESGGPLGLCGRHLVCCGEGCASCLRAESTGTIPQPLDRYGVECIRYAIHNVLLRKEFDHVVIVLCANLANSHKLFTRDPQP